MEKKGLRNWVIPEYSRSAVNKAGEGLRSFKLNDGLFANLDILSNWRAAHARPLQTTLMRLRKNSLAVDDNAIVVQRLKRLPSILSKLKREPKMLLSRMHDIGGCRAIVDSLLEVYYLRERLAGSKTRDTLKREYDYIKSPKFSGYRGIHLVYQYNGRKKEYCGLLIEVQLRSRIQHAWATTVEIVDTFTRQSLKASEGSKEWLRFFQLVADEFAVLEKGKLSSSIRSLDRRLEIRSLMDRLKVVEAISSFSLTSKYLQENQPSSEEVFTAFIIELDYNQLSVGIRRFFDVKRASEKYLELEEQYTENQNMNIVLVSADSLRLLQQGYPNYFGDTRFFLEYLNLIA